MDRLVPYPAGLLETVDRAVQLETDIAGQSDSLRYAHVQFLFKFAMQIGLVNVRLDDMVTPGRRQHDESTNRDKLRCRCERLFEVNSRPLREASCNKSSFVRSRPTILVPFRSENEFGPENLGAGGKLVSFHNRKDRVIITQ
ncbi:BQ5605_C015g07791 [Microbotryum silenes-dioicae]|uniref:BQ5605_C015g07791 protein n=1 Tax=Microbotryum silenes-dioicae TaxID=796604 RepID=A0A2X0NQK5_9BASI|nr:BQ5605_C015g07791 [Microbotryum silenes-dioicae]